MRNPKVLAIMFCLGVFLLSSTLKADEWNKKTIITFSGPVMVYKTPLPAGTYVFKLLDSLSDRHIVQIFNQDESHLIATILANPNYRLTPTGKTVVKFSEAGTGSEASGTIPENGLAMKEWFYPGDNFGQEFRVVPQPEVAAVQPEPAPEPVAAPAPEVATPAPAPEAATPAPEEPPAQEAAPSNPPPTEQPTPAPGQQPAPEQLPQTASQMPVVTLIGVLCLAAAASLRVLLKISA